MTDDRFGPPDPGLMASLGSAEVLMRHLAGMSGEPALAARAEGIALFAADVEAALLDDSASVRGGLLRSLAASVEGVGRSLLSLGPEAPLTARAYDRSSADNSREALLALETSREIYRHAAGADGPVDMAVFDWSEAVRWRASADGAVAALKASASDAEGVVRRDIVLAALSIRGASALLIDADAVDARDFMERISDAERAFGRSEFTMLNEAGMQGTAVEVPYGYADAKTELYAAVVLGTELCIASLVNRPDTRAVSHWRSHTAGLTVSDSRMATAAEAASRSLPPHAGVSPDEFFRLERLVAERWIR